MMYHVWQPLLANVAVIAVFISFWTSIQSWLERAAPRKVDAVFGSLCGGTGLAVMTMPFEIVPGVFFDLRSVVIILAAFFAGPVGGFIAGAMTGAFRIYMGGVGTIPGLVSIAIGVALGIFMNWQRRNTVNCFRDVLDVAFAAAGLSLMTMLTLPTALHGAIFEHVALPAGTLIFTSLILAGSAIVHENRRRDIARANEIYGAVMDALPDCLNAKDSQGRFLVANPATARLMGATDRDALIGKSDSDFYDAITASGFRKDEDRIIRWGVAETLEQRFVQNNGEVAWLSTLKVPFPSSDGREVGIITHNRDITRHKQLEINLAETQARLSDALAHMADGLVMFDGDAKLVYCNDRFRQMFSLPDTTMLAGTTLTAILRKAVEHFNIVLPDGMTKAEWMALELDKVARLESTQFQLEDGRWFQNRHAAVRDGAWLTVSCDITEGKRSERALMDLNARLEVLARTDGLTGLSNRKTFDDKLYAEFARSRRHGSKLGLMLIDVDRFKAFNDIYGHPEGDTCLKSVADCLKIVAKRPSDIAARYGGEEFVAIFPEVDEAGMQLIADQFQQSIRDLKRAHVGSEKGIATVSTGVAIMGADADLRGPADFLRLADEALYRAKGAGRDCVRIAETPLLISDTDEASHRAS
ncbi:MAG: domain S-box/diguanylate cyclase protein [Rhizobium sp.]|nr:domain S-box/diguanylate cyclase protein [Rhizobium sp.]